MLPTGYLTRMSSDRQQELTNDVQLARFGGRESLSRILRVLLGARSSGSVFGVGSWWELS
ncbi:MAG: hypothetical protein R3E39_20760 [Anaerolineae bacterium]